MKRRRKLPPAESRSSGQLRSLEVVRWLNIFQRLRAFERTQLISTVVSEKAGAATRLDGVSIFREREREGGEGGWLRTKTLVLQASMPQSVIKATSGCCLFASLGDGVFDPS